MSKNIKLIILFICVLAFSGMTIYGSSDALESLKQQEKEQQAKQKTLANKRDSLEAYKKEISSQFSVLESRMEVGDQMLNDLFSSIVTLELEIADMNMTIEEVENALDAKENEINRVKLELQLIAKDKEYLHAQAKERIRVMYEYGDAGTLEIVFESEDLMDMFSRLEYINRLVEADNDLFDTLDRFEDDILGKEAELEIHESTLQDLVNEALLERKNLEYVVTSKGLEVEHANELIETQRAYQETLNQEEAETEAELDAIEAEEARVDRDLENTMRLMAAEINRLNGYEYNGGMILWPVPGWTSLSSPFGPRLHPIHKTWKNHNGVDIPANGGTPIIAVMDGEVIIAKYSSSYGNYTAIAHGNGYVSLYAHCSSLNVSVGDKVNAGQTIAKVGTTGWSTGNHLHFGFQKDNVWINPMDYVN